MLFLDCDHILTLNWIQRSGVELPDKLANTLLNYHASRGDVPAFETSLSRLVNGSDWYLHCLMRLILIESLFT